MSATLSKKEALESLLSYGDVLVQLDPRVTGVDVPGDLVEQPLLVLRIGLDMPVPIPDLRIDEAGITATLSFNQEPYPVAVPWHAIYGMVSEGGQGLLWTGDVPTEVLDEMMRLSEHRGEGPEDPERPHLVALDGGRGIENQGGVTPMDGAGDGGEGPPDDEPDPEGPSRGGHLKLVR